MSLEYKGYRAARIEFDDGTFSGTVAGLRDVIHFEGATADQLEQAFRDSIDCSLDYCAKRGETPDKPYSGHVMIRIDPGLHWKPPPERKQKISASTPGSPDRSRRRSPTVIPRELVPAAFRAAP